MGRQSFSELMNRSRDAGARHTAHEAGVRRVHTRPVATAEDRAGATRTLSGDQARGGARPAAGRISPAVRRWAKGRVTETETMTGGGRPAGKGRGDHARPSARRWSSPGRAILTATTATATVMVGVVARYPAPPRPRHRRCAASRRGRRRNAATRSRPGARRRGVDAPAAIGKRAPTPGGRRTREAGCRAQDHDGAPPHDRRTSIAKAGLAGHHEMQRPVSSPRYDRTSDARPRVATRRPAAADGGLRARRLALGARAHASTACGTATRPRRHWPRPRVCSGRRRTCGSVTSAATASSTSMPRSTRRSSASGCGTATSARRLSVIPANHGRTATRNSRWRPPANGAIWRFVARGWTWTGAGTAGWRRRRPSTRARGRGGR